LSGLRRLQGRGSGRIQGAGGAGAFVAENRRRYSLEEAALVISENNTNGWTREDAKAALNRMANDGRVRIRRGLLWKGKLDLNPRPPPPILRRQRQVPIFLFRRGSLRRTPGTPKAMGTVEAGYVEDEKTGRARGPR
jgi:hypothetical protein